MKTSVRFSVLAAALFFVTAPSLHAERGGCNPHPQIAAPTPQTTLQLITYTVLSYFGL